LPNLTSVIEVDSWGVDSWSQGVDSHSAIQAGDDEDPEFENLDGRQCFGFGRLWPSVNRPRAGVNAPAEEEDYRGFDPAGMDDRGFDENHNLNLVRYGLCTFSPFGFW
jgi:hypothetical protein